MSFHATSWLDGYPIWCGLSTSVVMSEPMKTVTVVIISIMCCVCNSGFSNDTLILDRPPQTMCMGSMAAAEKAELAKLKFIEIAHYRSM